MPPTSSDSSASTGSPASLRTSGSSRVIDSDSSVFSPRSMKQLSFFFAGAGFLLMSTMITKRAVARKQIASLPKFYQPSHAPAGKQGNPDGSLIALEALNLATLNVCSFGLMAAGGVSWAFDISSLDELKQRARNTIRGEAAAGNTDEDAEREFEEWAARVLTKLGKAPPGVQATDDEAAAAAATSKDGETKKD